MPRTDINDDRSLSRLQGIDLREHGDSNTALDCVNVHLNNASRMTNFPPPTKVKSGVYYFACESKNPAAQEFELSLNGNFGSPAITNQESFNDGRQVKLTGNNLVGNTLVLLIDEDGHCLESGLDFELSKDGDALVLDMLWSDYGEYEKIVVKNAYGWATFNVDVVERLNNVLYFGNTFKVGIDNQTLEFCIWKHSQTNGWQKVASWKNESATPWAESATRKVEVEFFAIQDEYGAFAFMPSYTTTNQSLKLIYKSGDTFYDWLNFLTSGTEIQDFGNATTGYSPDWYSDFSAYEGRYNFGKYDSYRLIINNGTLSLQGRDTLDGDTYTTLQEWTYEA